MATTATRCATRSSSSTRRDHGDKTRLTLSDGPYTESTYAEAGWNGAFAKLDAMLA